MSGQRMFVAVCPPDDVRDHLDSFLDVRRAAADFRWVDRDQFHLTLAFLPAVPADRLEALTETLLEAADRVQPFELSLTGGGCFPSPAVARVLWAGVPSESVEPLERLSLRVRSAANRAGVPVDGQQFRPHVTVARSRERAEVSRWLRVLDGYDGPSWQVDRITLIASHLGERRQARHEPVADLVFGD